MMRSIFFGIAYAGLILLVFSLSEKETPQSSFAQLLASSSDRIDGIGDKNYSSTSIKSNLTTEITNTTLLQEPEITVQRLDVTYNDEIVLNLLSEGIENKLEKVKSIVEILSTIPEMKNLSYATHIQTDSDGIPGIPSDLDIEKRQIAKYILSEYPQDVVSVLFQLPNGDVYLLEPYERQQNLSTSNLSFRDYYQGVTATNDTFVGNVIISASSGLKQVQLAVPLYREDSFKNNDSSTEKTISGILSAGLNLQSFDKTLRSVNLTDTDYESIVLLDGNGITIAGSSKNLTNFEDKNETLKNTTSYKRALTGESGTILEEINGVQKSVTYSPVNAITNTWVLLLIKDHAAI